MKPRFRSILVYLFCSLPAGLALVSCNYRALPQQPTQPPDAIYTQAAQTIIAGLTQSAPLPTDTSTAVPVTDTAAVEETPLATETSQPTETQPAATETFTPEAADTQTPAVASTAVLTGTVVFEEDFEDETGWFTETNDQFSASFTDGAYTISVNIPEATVWSVRDLEYDDVILEVDVSGTEGPESGYYGLICRQQEDENYYALVMSSSGFFGIAKSEDGELEFLEEGTAQGGIIQSGEAANRVRADCVGETLALYVNGQKLVEIQDDDLSSGDVGLAVGTRGEAGVEAVFDNFVVIEPE